MNSITIKQMGSIAGDARVGFEIDRERKEVVILMFTARGKPFVSSRALEVFALQILPELGVLAFNSDSPKMLTDWTIFVNVGEQRFEVSIVKQGEVNGGAVVVELYPAEGPLTVLIAEPLDGRLVVDPQPGETPGDTAQRQGFVDLITKWKP